MGKVKLSDCASCALNPQERVCLNAVKDRVTGHNPLGPIYLWGNYYSWLNMP